MNAHPEYLTNHRSDREDASALDVDDLPGSAPRSHHPVNEPPSKPPRLGRLAFIAAIILVVALVVGLVPRLRERFQVARDTRELAVPTVAVVNPAPAAN